MRISPIEKPQGLMAKVAYFFTKRQLGKVITPMKVVNARMPKSFRMAYEMVKLEERGLTLDRSIVFLLKSFTATLNGCSFCVDIAKAGAVRRHLSLDKVSALGAYRTNSLFSARERAALAYVEEATRHRRVSDDVFEALRRHFSDTEIIEITWLNATENYYNLINLPLEIESDGLCTVALREARRDQPQPSSNLSRTALSNNSSRDVDAT